MKRRNPHAAEGIGDQLLTLFALGNRVGLRTTATCADDGANWQNVLCTNGADLHTGPLTGNAARWKEEIQERRL